MCSHGYHAFTWAILMLQQGKLRKEMQSQHPEAVNSTAAWATCGDWSRGKMA